MGNFFQMSSQSHVDIFSFDVCFSKSVNSVHFLLWKVPEPSDCWVTNSFWFFKNLFLKKSLCFSVNVTYSPEKNEKPDIRYFLNKAVIKYQLERKYFSRFIRRSKRQTLPGGRALFSPELSAVLSSPPNSSRTHARTHHRESPTPKWTISNDNVGKFRDRHAHPATSACKQRGHMTDSRPPSAVTTRTCASTLKRVCPATRGRDQPTDNSFISRLVFTSRPPSASGD